VADGVSRAEEEGWRRTAEWKRMGTMVRWLSLPMTSTMTATMTTTTVGTVG
jgi:hypothetical protein